MNANGQQSSLEMQRQRQFIEQKKQRRTEPTGRIYWFDEALPFGRAWACVRAALLRTKNQVLFDRIKEAWALPDCLKAMLEVRDAMLDTNQIVDSVTRAKRIYQATGEMPMPEAMFDTQAYNGSANFQTLSDRICEFIREAFNRESEKTEGVYKVVASLDRDKPLLSAVISWSLGEFCQLKVEEWDQYGKVRINGKLIDVTEPNSRVHRAFTKVSNQFRMTQVHNAKLAGDAEKWYQCRVNPGTVPLYIENLVRQYAKSDADADKGIEQSNIYHALDAFDDVTGYKKQRVS